MFMKIVSVKQRTWLILTAVILIAASCKKDDPRNNPYFDQQLVVQFGNTTIPFNLVDSATVIFRKQESASQVFKRLDKTANSLSVIINDLSKGNWTADVYIYARSADTTGRRYLQSVALTTLHDKQDIKVTGPSGKIDDAWKPSVVFVDADANIIATIPLDNREAAFDLLLKDKKWDHFYMERYAHNRTTIGNELMASGKWECSGGCFTYSNMIADSTTFIPFTETVKTKTWNNGEIYLSVSDAETGAEKTFFYIYNR